MTPTNVHLFENENDCHFHIIPFPKMSIITSNLPRTGRSVTNPWGDRSVRAVEDANAPGRLEVVVGVRFRMG